MDPEQLENRLKWLDEQRRKDNETIDRLTERLTELEGRISTQMQQIQTVSSELARLAGLTTRIHQVDEALSTHRKEISRQIGEAEDRRTEKEKALDELRKSDHRTFIKQLDEIRDSLGVIDNIQTSIDDQREETIRISSKFDVFEKRFEDLGEKQQDFTRTQISFDEAKKQDARRVTELQAETSGIRESILEIRGAQDSTGDRIRRLEVQIADLSTSEGERRDAQEIWTEQQSLRLVEFDRKWTEWERYFEGFDKKAEDLDERMQSYEETYRALKQMQADLNKVIERLDRRINEITELQRLADDRIKQEWTSFQADDQKRWNTFKLTGDEQWREHVRVHEKITSQLEILEENDAEVLEAIVELKEFNQERTLELFDLIRDWASEIEGQRSGGK
jgi:chromosome segregation ATPase